MHLASGVTTRVAGRLGIGLESPRTLVKEAEIDNSNRPWVTCEEQRSIDAFVAEAIARYGCKEGGGPDAGTKPSR
jgi:hypothetical protein